MRLADKLALGYAYGTSLLALSALIPLALFFLLRNTHVGWMLTKVYFGVIWLMVLAA